MNQGLYPTTRDGNLVPPATTVPLLPRAPRTVGPVSALAWWLIPLVATAVAILWTSVLARRERRRSDEEWRARKLAKVGQRLLDTELPKPRGGTTPESTSG